MFTRHQSLTLASRFVLTDCKDQHWSDFYSSRFGTSTDWVTGYIGYHLAASQFEHRTLRQAAQWLLTRRHNGIWGWGFDAAPFPSDADSTSFCALFIESQGLLTEETKNAVVAALFAHQRADGGFSTFRDPSIFAPLGTQTAPNYAGWCLSHVSVTANVLRCLRKLGVLSSDTRLCAGLEYLLENEQDGLWPDYWWRDPYHPTQQVLSTLSLFHRLSPATLARAARHIVADQQSDGSWLCDGIACAFSSAMALKTLCNLIETKDDLYKGVEWLLKAQRLDGSWAGHFILQIPDPSDKKAAHDTITNIHADVNNLFTTASVYSALTLIAY